MKVGSVIIALNAPHEATVGQIVEFQKLFLAPGFLVRLAPFMVSGYFWTDSLHL